MVESLITKLLQTGRIDASQDYSLEYLLETFLQLDLPVEVDGDGLVLKRLNTLLDQALIESYLDQRNGLPTVKIEILQTVGSTNEYLKKNFNNYSLPLICMTEYQTNGYGRRGSQWISSYASDITLSIRWKVPGGYTVTGVESLMIALAVSHTLERIGLNGVEVKWPNDIYVDGEKIAGILLEQIYKGGEAILIVGIGLNVKDGNADVETSKFLATSIESQIGKQDRNLVSAMLIEDLLTTLSSLTNQLSDETLNRWQNRDYLQGKDISIDTNNGNLITGSYQGIDSSGRLILSSADKLVKISSGHITEISS